MKPLETFLTQLYQQDVKLWLETQENNQIKLKFNAPEKLITKELITQIKQRKPEIIEFLKSTEINTKTSIKSISRDKPLPLSFAQQRLWFMEQLQTVGAIYNIPKAVKLTGKLDINILEKSLNQIINRHEVLRTNFITEAGQPKQIIHPTAKIDITIHDLQQLDLKPQKTKIKQLSQQEIHQPFISPIGSNLPPKCLAKNSSATA